MLMLGSQCSTPPRRTFSRWRDLVVEVITNLKEVHPGLAGRARYHAAGSSFVTQTNMNAAGFPGY
jgi:hypothetical protein